MIKNYANKVMDNEYNMFMTMMNVSVSKHLFDKHFTVLWANDYFYELIGYTKEEYERNFHNHVDEYYRDDPEAVAKMSQVILDAYQRQEPGYEFECSMHIKGGKTAWIRVTGLFTDEVFEDVPVLYTIYTDITKLKQLQQQLEDQSLQLAAALSTAKKASRAKSEFLSQMSHDIRTPMNAIIGMTNIAVMNINDRAKVEDCLKKISLSSQHLLGLINDVLDMSKIESGNIVFNLESVGLPEVLENIVTIMQPAVKENNLNFSVRLKQVEHEDLVADSLRLRQIFINLLSNAAKFTPANGSIVFEIEELSSSDPEYAQFQFTCSDTGIGIEPKFLPHIFESFTREHDSRVDKTEGSGLGLAITKRLTELLGGSITVESQLGKGSAFRVRLPLKITAPEAKSLSCMGLKILVVDNNKVECEYLAQTLTELGADVIWTDNGEEAVNQVNQAHSSGAGFDMALLDWKMPGKGGLQTAVAIRQVVGEELPILITSAYDWADIREEVLRAQFHIDGFLQKPLFKSTLCQEMQRSLSEEKVPQAAEKWLSLKGVTILLAEDNILNREVATELLSSMGAVVVTADDGVKAVAQFEQSPEGYYRLILMDIQMPNLNGYAAARQIRALKREDAATVPIIAMTADAFAEDVEAAKAAGMNSHLPKPFDLNSLNKEIAKFI